MRLELTLPPGELPTEERLVITSGPIGVEFRCTVETDGNRVHAVGTATGAGFVLDAQLTERDGATHVEGNLNVSGTLAGLGQRELALQARRFVSSLAGVR